MEEKSLECSGYTAGGTTNSVQNHSSTEAKPDISTNNAFSVENNKENNHCAMKTDQVSRDGRSRNKSAKPLLQEESLDDSALGKTEENEDDGSEDMSFTPGEFRDPNDSADVELKPGDALEGGNLSEYGNMKKDDSGIDIEKSPMKDSSSAAQDRDSPEKMDSMDGKGSENNTEIPSTSKESEEPLADPDTAVDPSSASGKISALKSLVDYSDDDDDDDDEWLETEETKMKSDAKDSDDENSEEDEVAASRKRRRPRRMVDTSSSSSSSSTTEGADEDVDEETKSEKSEEEEEMEADNDPARDSWKQLSELRLREQGYSNHMYMPHLFARKTCGSLNLVQRLELQYKMRQHEGCVNALHFNKSGTLLASGSDDLNIVLWNWSVNKPFMVFDSGHRSNVFQSKFMPYTGDCHVVSCARDGQIRLAELSSTGICKGTKKLAQHKGAAHKLALLEDSSHVFYSCGEDAATFQMDLRCDKPTKLSTTKENDRKVALYSIHANPFKSYEFCVGGRDHFVRIYDKRNLGDSDEATAVKKFCPQHLVDSDVKANVTCAVYNFNGSEVLGTYNDEDIYLFDNNHSDGADYIRRYKGHRNNATVKGVNFYGPESEFVVSGSDCGNVFLWDKKTENIVQYFHADEGGVINVLEPHPHFPILATSGLDHDVKIWTPSAKQTAPLESLKQVTKKNRKERAEERMNEPDMIDGQMLWFLMQQLRRTARRRARNDGEEMPSSSSNSDNNDSDNDSDDGPEHAQWQCAPS